MSDWQIRDSIANNLKVDETFNLLVKVARHLGIDTELSEKYFKEANDFRYDRKGRSNV